MAESAVAHRPAPAEDTEGATRYSVAGVNIGLRHGGDAFVQQLHAILDPFPHSEADVDWMVSRYVRSDERGRTLHEIWRGELPESIPARLSTNADRSLQRLSVPGAGHVEVDFAGRTIQFTVPVADDYWYTRFGAFWWLGVILARVGQHFLHAATLELPGHPAGRGLLLLGQSTAGKSTTSLALAHTGFCLHGDDLAALTIVEQGIRVWAYPRAVKARPGAMELIPALKKLRPQSETPAGRRAFDVAQINGAPFPNAVNPLRAEYLVFLDPYNEAEHRIRRIDPATAVLRLSREHVQPIEGACDERARHMFDALSQLARTTRLFAVSVGPDPNTPAPQILREIDADLPDPTC